MGLYQGRVNAGYFTVGPASTKPGYAFAPAAPNVTGSLGVGDAKV